MHATYRTSPRFTTEIKPALNPRRRKTLQDFLEALSIRCVHPKRYISEEFYAELKLRRHEVDGALDDGHALGVLRISECGRWFTVSSYSVEGAE